ncbi:hypothetical protein RI129_011062 [Pyrocoelia pectoralis]|uniref:Zinc finger PHD-type domain-containing protein n=1 Tax=Pyrocoelia pectoralis TaxID=417401 RepID=A0AAN7ZH64_9COLE
MNQIDKTLPKHDEPVNEEIKTNYVLPTQILPLPKRRDTVLRKSKGKKSAILTSTPVKDEIEEETKRREEKKTKGKRNVFETTTEVNEHFVPSTSATANDKKKTKVEKTKFEKKIEIKRILKNSDEDVLCPGCEESFLLTPNDDWIQCNYCEEWWHEACSPYEGIGAFKCDHCV